MQSPTNTPIPYQIILEDWLDGKVIPFLGSAASRVGCKDNTDNSTNESNAHFPPCGTSLAKMLARKMGFSENNKETEDLLKMASYYELRYNRTRLKKALRKIMLDEGYQPNPLHILIADIAKRHPHVIVTTNYDLILEMALTAKAVEYDLLIYPTDMLDKRGSMLFWEHGSDVPSYLIPNTFCINEKRTLIYKMHGSAIVNDVEDLDNYVITERDYISFLNKMSDQHAIPGALIDYFSDRSFLFLGYSLQDWNLRVMLENLSRVMQTPQPKGTHKLEAWAIQRNPSAIEQEIWGMRGVNIHSMDLEEFVTNLRNEMSAGVS
jgi:SIR2-like domain